jgi:ATP-dependent RNA helicase RhlE
MQAAYLVYDRQKVDLLRHLLTGKKNLTSVLIFCSTKSSVKLLDQELRKLKFSVKSIHSDLEQQEREDVLREFRNRQIQILVATDVVSRGIDIDSISLVINYDVPKDAEDYIHRVGRTARAETTGVALTFISDRDQGAFKQIENLVGSEIRKLALPPDMSPGPDYDPSKKT